MKRWCTHCAKFVEVDRPHDGALGCTECGKVLEDFNFSFEPTFMKDGAGQSHLSGNYVRTVQSEYSVSRERTVDRANEDMKNLCYGLGMDQPDGIVRTSLAFYRIALEKNFTRGRRTEQVQAACIYIACRESKLPYLLIDFSNLLKINVYVLGAVFLQLCKVLWLHEHPIVQKPLDPSLFIHKYTASLSGGRNNEVARTALRIIASMKRDWMQLRLVHICEATLTKRLVEFEKTESGSLTIEELNTKAKLEEKSSAKQPNMGLNVSGSRELLCEHKDTDVPHFAIGLCQSCYNEFVEFSGGLEGGLDPPAFQRAEKERLAKSSLGEKTSETTSHENEPDTLAACGTEKSRSAEPEKTDQPTDVNDGFRVDEANNGNANAGDESDTLSDIDDIEVDGYLHNEEEKHYKKIIWEEMNREYLEEQAAKEAAAAAAKEAYAANFKNTDDFQAAQELAAAAAAAVAKSRKERQQKRAAEAKTSTPAQTAAEAARQMLIKKRLSSKINYDVLEKLFDEPVIPENPKKRRTELDTNNDDKMPSSKEVEAEDVETNVDDVGLDDEQEDDDTKGADGDLYYGNEEEMYGYDDGNYDYDGF
ncbi:transcription factor IIIB 60 kDa subunit isoform X3 [Syzygium oleosum]|uniref:transcription factor IIIB 60 kDa subunit isoform X3 n=1 Tax=Syzygium oleosum TaxID=219896 RepID=UPI0024B8CACC|nr:transcription factor IIIB 60 kDa subunit isoform X3 [Syzygium oleosum]